MAVTSVLACEEVVFSGLSSRESGKAPAAGGCPLREHTCDGEMSKV
jgi:hypothetical protein